MTTAVQIGEAARDRADFCRCFKAGAAVLLHDDGMAAHCTYRDTLSAADMLAPMDQQAIARGTAEFVQLFPDLLFGRSVRNDYLAGIRLATCDRGKPGGGRRRRRNNASQDRRSRDHPCGYCSSRSQREYQR